MDTTKIEEVKSFVEHCRSDPSILHNPSLDFFKNFLESLGARIPSSSKESKPGKGRKGTVDEDIVESDLELDDTDVVEPDTDPPQRMGDPSIEVTEENSDAAQMLKSKAMGAISEGELNEAIDHLTEAIMLHPSSAILYASRASVFIKLKKPNAAIRDANAALKINADSAKGYKIRGMARAMLGMWEEAAHDLRLASTLDHDEEIALMLKKVEPNSHKIEEHRRKYERLRKERELKRLEHERQQRRAEAEAAYKRDIKMEPSESKPSDLDAGSVLKDGEVTGIHSASELETRLSAASRVSRLAILYFTATWCGPCRFISPFYTNLAKKYPKVVFLKVDIDEARDAAARWNISSVPSFFFIKNGKEIDKVIGADKASLERMIAQHAV